MKKNHDKKRRINAFNVKVTKKEIWPLENRLLGMFTAVELKMKSPEAKVNMFNIKYYPVEQANMFSENFQISKNQKISCV